MGSSKVRQDASSAGVLLGVLLAFWSQVGVLEFSFWRSGQAFWGPGVLLLAFWVADFLDLGWAGVLAFSFWCSPPLGVLLWRSAWRSGGLAFCWRSGVLPGVLVLSLAEAKSRLEFRKVGYPAWKPFRNPESRVCNMEKPFRNPGSRVRSSEAIKKSRKSGTLLGSHLETREVGRAVWKSHLEIREVGCAI